MLNPGTDCMITEKGIEISILPSKEVIINEQNSKVFFNL